MYPASIPIYTLSLHDALPISARPREKNASFISCDNSGTADDPESSRGFFSAHPWRSEEHTSELQSLTNLVCRLLLEQKKKTKNRKRARQSSNATRRAHNRYTD